jgi:hypothetical protein
VIFVNPAHSSSDNIAGILFLSDVKTGDLPFDKNSRFLNLEGLALFQRLLVIQSPGDDLKRQWDALVNSGMRVVNFDRTNDSAASIIHQLLGEPARPSEPMHSISPSASPGTLDEDGRTDDAIERYSNAARATGRHPIEAVVLLVGQSGHGKSKTINRLLGQNFLKVGNIMSGSTTKVWSLFQEFSSSGSILFLGYPTC